MKIIELLSPVGSNEALAAAIQNGADAIYMGGTKFNARRSAQNFSDDELRGAVAYAHLYNVKVYITLNTLIKEKELDELRAFLSLLESCKIDGVILQDIGAALIAAREYPALTLHASTQMTIHQLYGIKMLEKMGFSRVVPARELSLEEIKYIAQNTSIELETFIHGALCVCYSGQCLMSSILGGRSGNRGMCAQPCRLPYSLNSKNGKTEYHLSPKDLSTIGFLGEIISAGVKALKIEGRMKRPEYVAVTTKEYRNALDMIIEGKRSNSGHKNDEKELLQIFNRGGFTKGYYYHTHIVDLMSSQKPNHWGIYLGKVISSSKDLINIALEDELIIGDGIEFWLDNKANKGQTVTSMKVNGIDVQRAQTGEEVDLASQIMVKPGTRVYRTSSASQLKEARDSYANIYNKKIPIKATAIFKVGAKPTLSLSDSDGVQVYATLDEVVQRAERRPVEKKDIASQLEKLGDTPYRILELIIDSDESIFIPVSLINKLRRNAVKALNEKRIQHFEEQVDKDTYQRVHHANRATALKPPQGSDKRLLVGYIDNLSYSPEVLKGLDHICFAPSEWPTDIISLQKQLDVYKANGLNVRLVIPRITREADIQLMQKSPPKIWSMFDSYQAGNIGTIFLLAEKGIQDIYGSNSLNITNTASIESLAEFGVRGVNLSHELTIGEIHDIIRKSVLPCEIMVFGKIPLMITEYCPHTTDNKVCKSCTLTSKVHLTDRMGYAFPLRKRRIAHCYTEVLNSQTLFVADDMARIAKVSGAAWGLDLEGYTDDHISEIIGLHRYIADNPKQDLMTDLEDIASAIKSRGFTRGHFFRGVE